MPGIIPKASAGAINANNSSVESSATLPETFAMDCMYLGLPSDCSARILPSQINALVSEMLNLAACFDPNGTWACGEVDNMCTAWHKYISETGPNTLTRDVQDVLCARPTVTPAPGDRTSTFFLYCDDEGNIFKTILSSL